MYSVTVPVAQSEMRFAASAAQWMGRFYPGAKAELAGDAVTIEGEGGAAELKRMWRAALLNEQRYAQGADQRRELLTGLTR